MSRCGGQDEERKTSLVHELKQHCDVVKGVEQASSASRPPPGQLSKPAEPAKGSAPTETGEVGSQSWLNEWKKTDASASRYCSQEASTRIKMLLGEGRKPLLLICLVKVAVLIITSIGFHFLRKDSICLPALIACSVVAFGVINGGLVKTLVGFRQKIEAQESASKRSRRPGRPPPGAAPKAKPKAKPKAVSGETSSPGKKVKEEPRMPDFVPSVKVRQVFWSPLRLKNWASEDSFWSQISREDDCVNPGCIETAFKDKETVTTVAAPKAPQSQGNKSKVLSDSRRKQISVMFATLPRPADLKLGLLNMDQGILNRDQVERLLLNMPSSHELSALLRIVDDKVDLDPSEIFLLSLHDIPDLKLRLQVMHFENSMPDQIEQIRGAQVAISCSIGFLKKSSGIRHLLSAALFTGNYLNGGTARGRADGFAIEALTQLKDVKMNDGVGTLIHYITEQMEQKHPGELTEIFAPDQAADCIKQACRYNSEEVMKDLSFLKERTNHLLNLLNKQCLEKSEVSAEQEDFGDITIQVASSQEAGNSKEDPEDERKRFLPHLGKFKKYIEELEELDQQVQEAHKSFGVICTWFHVDTAGGGRTSDWFFDIWDKFMGDVKKALKERELKEKLKSNAQLRRDSLGTPRACKSGSFTPRDGETPRSLASRERSFMDKRARRDSSAFRHSWPRKAEAGGNGESGVLRRSGSRMKEYTNAMRRHSDGGITPRMLMAGQVPSAPTSSAPLSGLA